MPGMYFKGIPWWLSGKEAIVQSLGRQDPLEKETATQSSIIVWEIPGTEEPGWLQFMGRNQMQLSD